MSKEFYVLIDELKEATEKKKEIYEALDIYNDLIGDLESRKIKA